MAQTKQYTLMKPIHFTLHSHYGKKGDVLVYNPPKITVYRNGNLEKQFEMQQASVDAFVKNGFLKLVEHEAAPAVPAQVEVLQTRVSSTPVPQAEPAAPAIIAVAPVGDLIAAAKEQIISMEKPVDELPEDAPDPLLVDEATAEALPVLELAGEADTEVADEVPEGDAAESTDFDDLLGTPLEPTTPDDIVDAGPLTPAVPPKKNARRAKAAAAATNP